MNGYEKRTENKKKAIKKAAVELFFEKGITDTGVAEIAAKAKVSQVTIYNYFGSKDELLREVMLEYMSKMISQAEEILSMKIPFQEKLERMLSLRNQSNSNFGENFAKSVAWGDPKIQALYQEFLAQKALPMLIKLIEQGKAEGVIHESITLPAFLAYLSAVMSILTKADFLQTDNDFKLGINRLFYYGLLGK